MTVDLELADLATQRQAEAMAVIKRVDSWLDSIGVDAICRQFDGNVFVALCYWALNVAVWRRVGPQASTEYLDDFMLRALCPICGGGGQMAYAWGFSVPVGIRRHIDGCHDRLGVGNALAERWSKRLDPPSEEEHGPQRGFVYAIHDGEAIKIGMSVRNPRERLAALQTASHRTLVLLGFLESDNPNRDEKLLHDRFCAHRIRGEWFRDVDEIRGTFPQSSSTEVA